MVLVAVWALVALVVGLYVLFVVWRLRVERRKKAAEQNLDSGRSSVIARAATIAPPPVSPAPPPVATLGAQPAAASGAALTVAEALSGINLPSGLAPLTTMAPRGGVGDRVAFWTDVPVEVVGPAFGDELERLGYTITSLDQHTLAAQRGDTHLIAVIHPDGRTATIGDQPAFESVPEMSVVIEVWVTV